MATPALIEARALTTRVDTKFVMPAERVNELLGALADNYALVAVGTAGVARYRTDYLDTPGLALFHAHRRGLPRRQKIRVRHYVDRDLTVLEVKTRTGRAITSKERREISTAGSLGPAEREFLRARSRLGDLVVPATRVDYRRITLVGLRTPERITCDFDLTLRCGERRRVLPGLAIVEVKQPVLTRDTPAMRTLRGAGWRPGWASKYCLSVVLLDLGVGGRAFGGGLRAVRRIIGGDAP